MKDDRELVGTLRGFDDYVNMVLVDVTEYETSSDGRRVTKLDQIILNGNNITMVRQNTATFFLSRTSCQFLMRHSYFVCVPILRILRFCRS